MKQYYPCCGSDKVYKNKKLAQLVFSCRRCLANFLVIITTYPAEHKPSLEEVLFCDDEIKIPKGSLLDALKRTKDEIQRLE